MNQIANADDTLPVLTPEGAERRVLSYGGGLMLVQFRFAAGVTAPQHSHPHEQIGYVAEGAIDLLIDGREPVRLEAGASYYVPPDVRHGIVTHAPSVLLDCFSPLREDFL